MQLGPQSIHICTESKGLENQSFTEFNSILPACINFLFVPGLEILKSYCSKSSPNRECLIGRNGKVKGCLEISGQVEALIGACSIAQPYIQVFLQPHGLQPIKVLCPWAFFRQEYWRGYLCLPGLTGESWEITG